MSKDERDSVSDVSLVSPKSCDLLLGTVSYLNVQPMIWAVEKGLVGSNVAIVPEVPRRLAVSLAHRAYDTAIVPVFEYFRRPNFYTYLEAPVIAARGEVYSVMLYSSAPLENLKTVYLDVSSLTSVHLFKVIAAEKGLNLKYLDTGDEPVSLPLPPETGWVLIGDPAITQAGKHPFTLDLGLAWLDLTGLPFVFAAWLVPDGVRKSGMARLLNESLRVGLDNLEQVAKDSAPRFGVTPEFALRYFTSYIQYCLGDQELAGWKEFGRLCHKHHLISQMPDLRPYHEN